MGKSSSSMPSKAGLGVATAPWFDQGASHLMTPETEAAESTN
jgi:hypothetical protein